jgi:tetratricopeptide (TPR) repeat protein
VVGYADYARWLFDQINTPLLQGTEPTDAFVSVCKQLAQTRVFGEEWALRLDWAIAVKAYNYAKYLGEEAQPPFAEADALLATYPQYVQWVQNSWLGNSDQNLDDRAVGDVRKYWMHETERKMGTVIAAAKTLTAFEQANLVRTWQDGYYSMRRGRGFDLKFQELSAVTTFLDANPNLLEAAKESVKAPPSTPEALAALLKDASPEAQDLARRAMVAGISGTGPAWENVSTKIDLDDYAPMLNELMGRYRDVRSVLELQQKYPDVVKPHPLESAFRASIADGIKQNKLFDWQVMAWINMQRPLDNAEQLALMQALLQSLAWDTLPLKVQIAAREWFKKDAMTPEQVAWIEAGDPELACKELLALTESADAASAASALKQAIDGVKASPVRMDIQGLDQLAAVTAPIFEDKAVMDLVVEITDGLRYNGGGAFTARLFGHVRENPAPSLIYRSAACLWGYGGGSDDSAYKDMLVLIESLLETQPSAAYALSLHGVRELEQSRSGRRRGFNPASHVPAMKKIQGKAAMHLGLVTIPVPPTDPAYPVYKSQAEWMMGNADSALDLLNRNWSELLPNQRSLSTDYLLWGLQRVIASRDEARMKELVMALRAWANENKSPWSREQKLQLDIAYGDIALQLGQLENARKIFVAAQRNPEYAELTDRHQATLRRVKMERIARRFDDALQTLMELDQERIPEMWVPSRYARAEVRYDMEEFVDAAEDIASILTREPGHVDARIMQGKIHLKQQNLIEASELDVGSRNAKNTLIPGEDLKVTLIDPTLEVTGAGTDIEVLVWTTSGDRETFLLRQFGDEKTKLRGEITTALGAAYTNDSVLQVKGDDEIFYAYSERFRKNMGLQEEAPGGPITVRSDGLLIASARTLLTAAEQRAADTGRKLSNHMSAALGALEKAISPEDVAAAEARLAEVRARELLRARIKPGQSINIRVVDPDRSRSAGIDEVTVGIEASSGDAIARFVLKETTPHSGIFEGRVPTAGAQAVAYALNSEPGRDPNMVISPTRGYPAWRPKSVAGVEPAFKVDLNDSESLGEMVITAKEPGAKLKQFFLQTGTGSADLTTVAVFPTDHMTVAKPWHPSVTIMRDRASVRQSRSVYDLSALEQFLDRGWMSDDGPQGVSENVAGPSTALTNAVANTVRWSDPRQSVRRQAPVIYRFRSYFYEAEALRRRFKLELGPQNGKTDPGSVQFLLAVDGIPITDQEQMQKLEGEIELNPGLHRFEIWATGWSHQIGFGRSVRLLANLDVNLANSLVDVPDSFFDPAGFPREAVAHRNGKATITPNAAGTQFTVRFAPDSHARLLNLVFLEQEGSSPALNTITLKDADGGRVLPVPEDYAQLRKNDTLEIVPDDRVVVRYIDDRFVSKSKEKHERFLAVSFSTASISFRFQGMREGPQGEKIPYYEELYRFAHGDSLSIVVEDGDMDVSPEPDTVNVTLSSRLGGERTFVAAETGPSTATFELVIVPVLGAPANPNEFQVGKGEFLSATYLDEENATPGRPPERFATVQNAVYKDPIFRVSHTASVWPIKDGPRDEDGDALYRADPRRASELPLGFTGGPRVDQQRIADAVGGGILRQSLLRDEMSKIISPGGLIYPCWMFSNTTVEVTSPPPDGIRALLGRRLSFSIEAPHLALRPSSSVDVYVQTASGRHAQRGGKRASAGSALHEAGQGTNAMAVSEPQGVFDITVPGTLKLRAVLGRQTSFLVTPSIPIYTAPARPAKSSSRGEKSIPMQFAASVPVITGTLPDDGHYGLVVRPGETIYIGFRYADANGAEQWLIGESAVSTHPVLDVMTEDYREALEQAFVGESMYLRVVDLGADISDQGDSVEVLIQAESGAKYRVELPEVDTHSGVFRGRIALRYASKHSAAPQVADDSANTNTPAYNVLRDGFPVVYGDVVAMRYTDANDVHSETRLLHLMKGADATLRPFSKKYKDEDIAMRTQFALAEANLEMAKRHRRLGQKALAKDEYARAKDLLQKAMEMFRDPTTRAQAEYMLGSLTQEEAETTSDQELQEERYRAALSRYMRVTRRYGETLPAAKAQFMIATVYEALGEPEIAAQEYVKLAYKYPDSEFLALAMARLGTHFQRKAAAYEKQAKKLLAQTEDADALSQGSAFEHMYISEYIKSAEIFTRLQRRFPDHEFAGKGGLRAGQAYMRAAKNRDAVNVLKRVFENESYNGRDVRAEAMYWGGVCYDRLGEPIAAYAVFKRLTYDFPESKWAAFARGQLSSEKLLRLEVNLERKRLEEGQ